MVEVISPTDKYTDINSKVDTYLTDGVKLIWIVDPQRKTIAVYEGNDTSKTLRAEDMLSGRDVLPDFELSVKDILVVNNISLDRLKLGFHGVSLIVGSTHAKPALFVWIIIIIHHL